MNLKVNEIFYSLQGEGARTGEASIFIRLSGCNLACGFCDTDFEAYTEKSIGEIASEIAQFPCKWIIWTGGEPTLQLTDEVVAFFKSKGYMQAIETNGTQTVPVGLDYIACSPKQHFETIRTRIPRVNELRLPIQKGDKLPDISTLPQADNYFLSPVFDDARILPENVEHCVHLILENPAWKLSLQTHKLTGIR